MNCTGCGKPITNKHFINGKAFGYACYKKKLALIYKQWEDEKNIEYSKKCFAAMAVFTEKNDSRFQQSILKQWDECKKLTAKQLECIIKSFTAIEKINFYKIWFQLTNEMKEHIASWIEQTISANEIWYNFVEDESIHDILLTICGYKKGFYFFRDVEDEQSKCFILSNNSLKDALDDEYTIVIKVVN